MRKTARLALELLNDQQRRRMSVVLVVMVVAAALEAVGVGSIFPFLNALTDPTYIQSSTILSTAYDWLGMTSERMFMFVLGGAVLSIIVLTQVASALSAWLRTRFTYDLSHDLAVRLMAGYMSRPYGTFLEDNTSDLGKNVFEEVGKVVSDVFQHGMQFISQGLIIVAILGSLLWMNPIITLTLLGGVGGIYGLIYLRIRRTVADLGRRRNELNKDRYRTISEGLQGIKPIKAHEATDHFLERFERPSRRYVDALTKERVINEIPTYLMRIVTFGGLLGVVLALMWMGYPPSKIVPIAGVFAYGGYRLMPAFHRILTSLLSFSFREELLERIHRDITNAPSIYASSATYDPQSLGLDEEIRLDGVHYRYRGSEEDALADVDLAIPKDSAVGIVGFTGAGKTTLVDILLGLLEPTRGELRVDGVRIGSDNVDHWRRSVGYVPQEIYLLDDTIRQNIAFGVPESEIADEAVYKAARTAHIHEFIEGQLRDGYDTVVGERGARLSGGQRQRIGIARALYHDPDVLIFDEATSDIDTVTEANITRAISEIAQEKTLIVIAHRLSTLDDCDQIYYVEDGRIVDQGPYEELAEANPQFRAMTKEVGRP